MSLDTYDEHNSRNPINEKEIEVELTELEEAQEYNWELNQKNKKLVAQLKKLAEFHQIESWGMSLSYDQLKEKQEIINKYLP